MNAYVAIIVAINGNVEEPGEGSAVRPAAWERPCANTAVVADHPPRLQQVPDHASILRPPPITSEQARPPPAPQRRDRLRQPIAPSLETAPRP